MYFFFQCILHKAVQTRMLLQDCRCYCFLTTRCSQDLLTHLWLASWLVLVTVWSLWFHVTLWIFLFDMSSLLLPVLLCCSPELSGWQYTVSFISFCVNISLTITLMHLPKEIKSGSFTQVLLYTPLILLLTLELVQYKPLLHPHNGMLLLTFIRDCTTSHVWYCSLIRITQLHGYSQRINQVSCQNCSVLHLS